MVKTAQIIIFVDEQVTFYKRDAKHNKNMAMHGRLLRILHGV